MSEEAKFTENDLVRILVGTHANEVVPVIRAEERRRGPNTTVTRWDYQLENYGWYESNEIEPVGEHK